MTEVALMVYEFGDSRLDLGRRELYVCGQLADLQPRTFDLLAYFVAHVGRAISKDELLAKVWANSVGSDAMVARAVMKVRRALGDDGQDPRLLKTVHRVGYRLDMHVRKVAPSSRELPMAEVPAHVALDARASVLLRCRNQTKDGALDWVEHGLPGLIQQLAGPDARLAIAPAGWPAQTTEPIFNRLARVCGALGAREAIELELHRRDDVLELHVHRGCDEATATKRVVEGGTVTAVARAFAHSLVEGPKDATASSANGLTDSLFWEEQLARAHDLERRGALQQALALMDECVERLPPSAQRWLAHATMLRRVGRRDEAGKRARAALELAQSTQETAPELRARALYEMALQAWHESQPPEAARLSEAALAAAQLAPAAASLIPDILSFHASISREREAPVVGIRLAERAIAAALALGDRSKESHARVVLGSALLHTGQSHRASDVLRRAADLACHHGFVQTEAYALRTLALLDEQAGRYSPGIEKARRAAALAAGIGNFNLRDSARVQEVVSLVHLGQFDEAREAAARLGETVERAWENAQSLRYALALLAWRQGEGSSATLLMRRVADEWREKGLRFANVARLEECFQHVSANDLQAAQEALTDLERADAKVSVLQARAALSLAQGDRGGSIAYLREAASVALLDSADSVQIDTNLAWLLLEDGRWDEASALIGQVAESLSERLAARVLSAAHLLATNPRALADGEWETLICLVPKLPEQCSWLLQLDVADRLRTGTMPRLPEMLTRACW